MPGRHFLGQLASILANTATIVWQFAEFGDSITMIATLVEISGLDRESYDRVGSILALGGIPDGVQHHACGPVPGGWRILEIWESIEAFDRFVDGRFIPALDSAGEFRVARREVMTTYHAGSVLRTPH
jgi:hypothetical protein